MAALLWFRSLLIHLRKLCCRRWPRFLKCSNHVRDPEEAPGSWLQPAFSVAAIWELNQWMKVCSVSVFPPFSVTVPFKLEIPSNMSLFKDVNLWNLETRKQLAGKGGMRRNLVPRDRGCTCMPCLHFYVPIMFLKWLIHLEIWKKSRMYTLPCPPTTIPACVEAGTLLLPLCLLWRNFLCAECSELPSFCCLKQCWRQRPFGENGFLKLYAS